MFNKQHACLNLFDEKFKMIAPHALPRYELKMIHQVLVLYISDSKDSADITNNYESEELVVGITHQFLF